MAHRGFDIALTDIASDGVDEVRTGVESAGGSSLFVLSDLADVTDHARVLDAIVEWRGTIACLISNAGVAAPKRGDLLELEVGAFDQVLEVNLRGTFFFTQAVAKQMLAAKSTHSRSIITVSSVSAELASPERGEYCMSKAALAMAVKLFALRLAAEDIAVFEVRPGVIRTPMTEGVAKKYEARIANGLVPMRRWGYPEDVARAVAALACGEFAFATGSVINVDGGLGIARL